MNKVINISDKNNSKGLVNNNEEIGGYSNGQIIALDFKYKGEIIKSSMGNVLEVDGRYVNASNKGLSNFIINPVELIQNESFQEMKIEIVGLKGEKYYETLSLLELSSSKKFKAMIDSKYYGLYFYGNDDDMYGIKDIMTQKDCNMKIGINITGIVKHNGNYIFASESGVVNKEGKNVEDVIFKGNNDGIESTLTQYNPITKEELTELSENLFKFNTIENVSTILGFSASCFLKERLWDANGTKFYHLIMCGEAGSGKTQTSEDIMMPIFSTQTQINVDQSTKFTLAKIPSTSNTIPLTIEEYKPNGTNKKNINCISELLRNSYNRTESTRGRSDGSIDRYALLAPVVLVGEMSTSEAATIDRGIITYFAKKTVYEEIHKQAYGFLKNNSELLSKLGLSLLLNALNIEGDILIERQAKFRNKIKNDFTNRLTEAISSCSIGITMIEDVYKSLGLDFEEATGLTIDELINQITYNVKENMLDNKTQIFGNIDKSIETFNDMYEIKLIKKGIHFEVINKNTEIALSLNELYPLYLNYIKSRKLDDIDVLPLKDYKKQLTMKEYFVKGVDRNDRTVKFNDGANIDVKRAYVLNIEILKEKMDISNLC